MSKPLKIQVTKAHIARGGRERDEDCPVAQAIHARMGRAGEKVFVGDEEILVFLPDRILWAKSPLSVTEFVRAYEEQLQVVPFEFELRLRPWSARED